LFFTATFPYAATIVQSNPKIFRYDLVYEKPNASGFLNARSKPLRAHENILIFYKKRPIYNPQMIQGVPYRRMREGNKVSANYDTTTTQVNTINEDGLRFPRSIVKFAKDQGLHPTQKPVALMEWLVKTYTNEGAWVLDPTMGSGSTAIACMNTNRYFTGIEKDATIFQVAKQRVELHANSIIEKE
jgi:DNA modification methylase